MTAISIGRWHNRYRAPDLPPPRDLADWDAAPRRIDPPMVDDGGTLVLIRSLAIAVTAEPGEAPAALSDRLQSAFARELEAALGASPAGGSVRYEDRAHVLADMLYRACCGDGSRTWAWRQLRLLPDGAASPGAVRQAALAALIREPLLIWPVLARLVRGEAAAGSVTALAGALAEAELRSLVAAAPQAAELLGSAAPEPDLPRPPDSGPAPGVPPSTAAPDGPLAKALLRWCRANPILARRHCQVLATLVATLERQAPAAGVEGPALRAEACALVDAAIGTPPAALVLGSRASADRHLGTRAGSMIHRLPAVRRSPVADADPAAPTPAAPQESAAPDLPATPAAVLTKWGGALFMLPLLSATGFPDRVQEVDAALPVALAALLAGIGVPDEDCLVDALCGPVEAEERHSLPPDPVADALAALEALLRLRLGPAAPGGWFEAICRREAWLSVEPGWIEAAFALGSVDLRLRRAALDLDPGWIPWLGRVVRYRYV